MPLYASTEKIDSLLLQLTAYKNENVKKVKLLNSIGYEYWIVDANESIRFGAKALALSEQLAYEKGIARSNHVIGVAYWAQGNLTMALQHLNNSHKKYQIIQDKTGLANTRLNIGMVYADLEEYKKALYYYEQAINEFTVLGLKSRIATTFTKIGIMFIAQNKGAEALQYLTDALQMHTATDFTYGIAEVHNKLGLLYLHKNEIEQAHYHIKKSMQLGSKVSDIDGLTNNHILHSKILRKSNKLSQAELAVSKGLQLAKDNNLKKYELLAYEELKELKKLQFAPQEAFLYYDKFIALRDSLFNQEKSRRIAYLEFENELEQRDKALVAFKAQEKKDKTIQLLLLSGVALLIMALTVIYVISKQRTEKNKELAIQNQKLLEAANELNRKKLENAALKQQELSQQLAFKSKKLSTYTLNFIKRSEILQQIQKTITTIKKSPSLEKSKLIEELNKIIRKNESIDNYWEDFSRFFEDAHQGFYTKLKSRHSDLSTNDLKVCSLIRLNLSTKEMAGILGVSPDSAKTARYRLRKKMKLSPEQEIFMYLVQLEQEKGN